MYKLFSSLSLVDKFDLYFLLKLSARMCFFKKMYGEFRKYFWNNLMVHAFIKKSLVYVTLIAFLPERINKLEEFNRCASSLGMN